MKMLSMKYHIDIQVEVPGRQLDVQNRSGFKMQIWALPVYALNIITRSTKIPKGEKEAREEKRFKG